MFTSITSLAKRILTLWRSSLAGLLGSSTNPSGHFQNPASASRAASGIKISGERLEVPDGRLSHADVCLLKGHHETYVRASYSQGLA